MIDYRLDTIKKDRKYLKYCAYCPKMCRFACPVSETDHSEATTPFFKIKALDMVIDGALDIMDPMVASLAYKCTNCRLCTEFCQHGVPVSELLNQARAVVSDKGMTPPTVIKHLANTKRNIRERYAEVIEDKYLQGKHKALFYPGVHAIMERPSSIRAFYKLLQMLKIDYVGAYNGNNLSAGLELLLAGDHNRFVKNALALQEELKGKVVYTACGETAYALKYKFVEYGIDLSKNVFHLSEIIPKRFHNLPRAQREPVLFHDASYVARALGLVEPSRELLRSIGTPIEEFPYHGRNAHSSGSGGLFPVTHPRQAHKAARRRWQQALEGKARVLVTADPHAASHLEKSAPTGFRVLEMTEYLAEQLT
jgi:Fe-S oxidoreductase